MPINWADGSGAAADTAAPNTNEPSPLRRLLAGIVRTGAGWGASIPAMEPGIGSVLGGGIAGAGELAAEKIEGSPTNAKRIGVEAGLGAVPLGKVFQAGRPLQSAIRSAALAGTGEAGRELAEGQDVNTGRVLGTSALGGLLGGVLGHFPSETAPAGPPTGGPRPADPRSSEIYNQYKAEQAAEPPYSGGAGMDVSETGLPGQYSPSEPQSVAQQRLDLIREMRAKEGLSDEDKKMAFSGSLQAKNEVGGTERVGIRWAKTQESAVPPKQTGKPPAAPPPAPALARAVPQAATPFSPGGAATEPEEQEMSIQEIAAAVKAALEGGAAPAAAATEEAASPLAKALGVEGLSPTKSGFDPLNMFGKGVQVLPTATNEAPPGVLEGTTNLDVIGRKYRQMGLSEPEVQGRADQIYTKTKPEMISSVNVGTKASPNEVPLSQPRWVETSGKTPLTEQPVTRELGRMLRVEGTEAGVPNQGQLDAKIAEYINAGLSEPEARQMAANSLAVNANRQAAAAQPFNGPRLTNAGAPSAGGPAPDVMAQPPTPENQSKLADMLGATVANTPKPLTPALLEQIQQAGGFSAKDMAGMSDEAKRAVADQYQLWPKPKAPRGAKAAAPSPQPFNGPKLTQEGGFSSPADLARMGLAGMGALAGAGVGGSLGAQAGHPLLGALAGGALGAGAGAYAPTAIKAAFDAVGSRMPDSASMEQFNPVGPDGSIDPDKLTAASHSFVASLPQIQRFNYLAQPFSLAPNIIGSYGSALMAGFEKTLMGDPMGPRILRKFANPLDYFKEMETAVPQAKAMMAAGGTGAIESTPTMLGRTADAITKEPGAWINGGHQAARNMLMSPEVGMSPEEAAETTLSSQPWSKVGQGLTNLTRQSPIAQMLLPFVRTPMNMFEQGAERLPGLGFLVNSYKPNPTPLKLAAMRQLLGAGVGAGASAIGSQLDPETAKIVRNFVTRLSGQYALPANIGFAAGQAMEQGKPVAKAASGAMVGGLPLPTAEPITEWLNFLSGNGPVPSGAYPKGLIDMLRGTAPGGL